MDRRQLAPRLAAGPHAQDAGTGSPERSGGGVPDCCSRVGPPPMTWPWSSRILAAALYASQLAAALNENDILNLLEDFLARFLLEGLFEFYVEFIHCWIGITGLVNAGGV